jgi:hypothetical protein
MTESPFHIMNAVESMRAKLRTCAAACRGFCRAESIVMAWEVSGISTVACSQFYRRAETQVELSGRGEA